MKRVIILEGPDGGGKTMLGAALASEIHAVQLNHGPYPEVDGPTLWLKYLHSMLPAYAGIHDVILDRAWQAEPIYGAAFRGGANRIVPWQRRILERVALGSNAILVYCLPPFRDCLETWTRRKETEYLNEDSQLRAVYDGYGAALTGEHVLPTYLYDRTRPEALERTVAYLKDQTNWGLNAGPGVGAWRPGGSILLVGERPGGAGGPHAPAFCGTSPSGSSAWLAQRLEDAGIPESALYWVNAYADETDDQPLRPGFVDALEPKKIFLLGTAAAAWADDNRIEGVRMPHPQHWKRFHHNEPYQLIKELSRCIR